MRYIKDSDWPLYCEIRDRLEGATTWRDRIQRCMPESRFRSPGTERDFKSLEQALGHGIPAHLREVLSESNGIDSPYSTLFYSTSEIVEINQRFRAPEFLADLSMPFDHLVFFGTVSDGDEFALPRLKDGSFGRSVFIWSHESDCREEYANGLLDYVLKYTVEIYTPYVRAKTGT